MLQWKYKFIYKYNCIGVTLFTWSTHVNWGSACVEPVDPCVDHGWCLSLTYIGITSVSPSWNFWRFLDATTDLELRVRGHYTEFCETRLQWTHFCENFDSFSQHGSQIVFTFSIFYSSCQWITLNPFLSLLTEQWVKIILWQLTIRKELDWQAIWQIRTRILCATVAIHHLAQQLQQVSIEIHVKTG